MSPTRDFRSIPKAHLHIHFVGAMRPTTLGDLAARYHLTVPPSMSRYGTFSDFQDRYLAAVASIQTEDDLTRLAREIVEDAQDDGVVWIEPAINLANHASLGSAEKILELVIAAGEDAGAHTGVGVGWIVEADRTLSPAAALEEASLAARFAGRGVVGFGLANDENAAPAEAFEEAFDLARAAGLLAVPHAGEHVGPESVRAAIEVLGAVRVGHGARAIEDEALVGMIASRHVCLDVCPTSNLVLSVTPDLGSHPLPRLLASGVHCSINADDPLLFGAGVLNEYAVYRELMGLDDAALATCARYSLEHSAAPQVLQEAASSAIESWLRRPE